MRRLQAEVANGTLTRKRAMTLIAEVEFTEWNELFLYVVRKFGRQGRALEKMCAVIQEHERSAEAFIGALPSHLQPERDLATLAKIWDSHLLVVDDSPAFRDVVVGLLKSMGQVTAVADGESALAATRRHFFNAVVSDIRMPGMSGIEFHRRAVAEHPDLQNRFVFMSFAPEGAVLEYLVAHKVPLLMKPFSPEELVTAVNRIVTAAHTASSASGDGVP